MSTTIRARVAEVKPDGDNMDVLVEYVGADGRVLERGRYTVANKAALGTLTEEVVKQRLRELTSRAHVLVGDLVVMDADTGEVVESAPGIPDERAAQYAAIFALYRQTGAAEAPADFATAFAVIEAWINAAETADAKVERLQVALKLSTLRAAMIEGGCTWSEALAWFAAQQQQQ